jgi:hypothetical protein
MKIGILIKDFSELANWELRIIAGILNRPDLELALLIQDGRIGDNKPNSLKNRINYLFKSKNILGKLVFKTQLAIESKIFRETATTNREELTTQLSKIPVIKLNPTRKGFLDIFSETDAEQIKGYDLDIILRHEFNIIRGPILQAAKYGIWSFHHADNLINRGGPAGFWEIMLKQASVGVTLQQLTPELDGGLVIDKAYFNYHWSFIKTNRLVLEASVSLLFKNIDKLQQGLYFPTKSLVYYNPLYKSPNLFYSTKYLAHFYSKFMAKLAQHLKVKLFGTRYNCWTLWIGKGDFMEATLFRLKPVSLPKTECWADPFIFKHQDEVYIFFESYNYQANKGKICCGKLKNGELVDIQDVLKLPYHLSYPFIFEEDGAIYLMPETLENNRLELYKCICFPDQWELYATAFEGEQVADAHFYTDEQQQRWLFINKQADLNAPIDSELFIYKVNSLKLDQLEPHQQNPVLINSKIARNGGAIFNYNHACYRPSQANIEGIYGRALNINKIEKLTLEEYRESTVITVFPNFQPGLGAMHHLHQSDGLFVIDAAYRKL